MSELLHYILTADGPVALPKDKHVYFGRAPGNTFVVNDMRASRQHADLYWDGSVFILMDLNSSNGTYVNNERITSRILKDGDEITIGMQTYRYRAVSDFAELIMDNGDANQAGMVTAQMPAMQNMLPDADFNGTLGAMSVAEICQMLQLGCRNGMLIVVSESKGKGLLYFQNGQIVSAECGLLSGDQAALQVLRIKKGTFSFRTAHPKPIPNITRKTAALIFEAARQADESVR